ncbi:MAG: cytochrome c biogenesis protein CcdA [Candidatus Acidiferrales bacterium]|jgi:cytochrome c-type biogenesis protein
MRVSIFAALVAGLISFLSPCVLPLVPGYISMLSGIGVEQLQRGEKPRGSLLASAVAFVCGFSLVFIGFGASASAVGQFLVRNKGVLGPVAGVLIIMFGLHLIGWLGKLDVDSGLAIGGTLLVCGAFLYGRHGTETTGPGGVIGGVPFASLSLIFLLGPRLARWLNRDVHFRNLGSSDEQSKSGGPLAGVTSGFLLGFAFAFGWTPCIGPILASVLAMAAASQTVGRGIFLLAVYSAGLAIPFLITALALNSFLRFYQRFRRYLHAVEVCSGVLLLFVGGLIFFDRLTWLSGKLAFLNRFVR